MITLYHAIFAFLATVDSPKMSFTKLHFSNIFHAAFCPFLSKTPFHTDVHRSFHTRLCPSLLLLPPLSFKVPSILLVSDCSYALLAPPILYLSTFSIAPSFTEVSIAAAGQIFSFFADDFEFALTSQKFQ
jgi:hypothetical protein